MAKTKEKWSAEIVGRPDVVARHIEIPIRFFHEPDRPAVALIPLSKTPVLVRALVRLLAKYAESPAVQNAPDLLESED